VPKLLKAHSLCVNQGTIKWLEKSTLSSKYKSTTICDGKKLYPW